MIQKAAGLLTVIVSCFSIGNLIVNADEPDLKTEKKFHEIYLKYNTQPLSEQTWSGMSSTKPRTYQIQKGDTLWDLSSALFGQADFWPKVWSINNEKVSNPHEILPLQVLEFFPGSVTDAPSISLGQAQPAPELPLGYELTPEQLKAQAEKDPADLPERLKKPAPVQNIPGSFPNWQFRKEVPGISSLELPSLRVRTENTTQSLAYFVVQDMTPALGEVLETEMGGEIASDFQYIYIKLESNSVEKNLLALRHVGEIKDPVTKNKAHLIEAQGEIEVLENIDPKKGIFRALVRRSILPVQKGARLVVGQIPTFVNSSAEPLSQALARVVGGEYTTDKKMYGNQEILFLSGTGLEIDQVYPIYKVQKLRNEKTVDTSNDRQIGRVKVIQTSGSFATAVVIEAKEDIKTGDITNPDVVVK